MKTSGWNGYRGGNRRGWTALLVCGALLGAIGGAARAAETNEEVTAVTATLVSGNINYQGVLKLADGTPLTGIQHIIFRIFDSAEGGSMIWARGFPVTCTTEGVFNVVLGDGGMRVDSPAEEHLVDAFQGTARWLELTVEDYGTILPRRKITTAPYAFQAQYGLWSDADFTVGQNMTVGENMTLVGALTVNNELTVSSVNARTGSLGEVAVTGEVTVPAGQTNDARGVIPVGGILLWASAQAVPDGWAVCDGSNGTPDMRGLFVMGAGSQGDSQFNAVGGERQHMLDLNEIPPHSHSYVYPSGKGQGSVLVRTDGGSVWRYDTTKTTSSTGSGQAHENRPPYYALYYIMRIR